MTIPHYDVIVIGGSAAGLSAAMTLGRALRNVLIIDSCDPCNVQTPRSHNFLSRDGFSPSDIIKVSLEQVLAYPNITLISGEATHAVQEDDIFRIEISTGQSATCDKLLLATGLRDIFPDVEGFRECWGISVLHCPYCHGYEVRDEPTVIFANGEAAYHLSVMVHNWSKKLTVVTNGISELRFEEASRLEELGVTVIEKEVSRFEHENGHVKRIAFNDGTHFETNVIYASIPFEQKSDLAEQLGCKISSHNHIEVDDEQRTTIENVFAAGDCTAQARAISVAAASGTKAGFTINLEMVLNEKMPSDK